MRAALTPRGEPVDDLAAGRPRQPFGNPPPGRDVRPDAPAVRDVPGAEPARPPLAVLFDRDGTLVEDVPYNGDPERVRPMPGALAAVRLLREAGIPVGVVSNQSGIGRGLLTADQVQRVNDRVDALLGSFGVWAVCPHHPDAGCACRKPEPGLVLLAAGRLGVDPRDCVVIGDIGADLGAARAAGARGIIVPTSVTRREEYAEEPDAAPDLLTAVRRLLPGPHATTGACTA